MDRNTIKKYKEIIEAGELAVNELIRVAEEIIITGGEDDVTADRLKNAAATKKLSVFDAFEIMDRLQAEREKVKRAEDPAAYAEEDESEREIGGWAERRAK